MNYSNYKKLFVPTGVFYSTSGEYTGYVEVLSGVPYIANTSTQLSLSTTFETDLITSEYFLNRSVTDDIALPYDSNQILFQGNDFLNSRVFNDKLSKLNTNNIFIYSRMHMANNNLPTADFVSYYGLTGSSDTTFQLYSDYSSTIPFANSVVYSYLSGIIDFEYVVNNEDPNKFAIFAITNTEFISLTGNSTEIGVVERSTKIETTENAAEYRQLHSITHTGDFIFITDYQTNYIYKYEIAGYFNNDSVLLNKRNLIEIVGGRGRTTDNTKFNGVSHITSNDKYIVVNDSNNGVLKVYDLNFNYVTKINSVPFKTDTVKAIKFNRVLNLFYFITEKKTNRELNLYIFDVECFNLDSSATIPISLSTTENVLGLEFSFNNSDYYYIITNEQVYKFFVSRPDVLIGRYTETRIFNAPANTTPLPITNLVVTTTVSDEYIRFNNQNVKPMVSDVWDNISLQFDFCRFNWNDRSYSTYNPNGDIYVLVQEDPNPLFPYGYGTTTTLEFDSQGNTYESTAISTFEDTYKGLKFVESTSGNYDKCILLTNARIYVYNESNNFKKIIKPQNIINYGTQSIGVRGDEYIQASVINKEFYKVLRDIFALKNNLLGRFSGIYDFKEIIILDDYNYNLDFNEFNVLDVESYYIHENEKNILGVINRALANILTLQQQLLEFTKVNDQQAIKPVLTPQSSVYSNVLIIE